MELALENGKYTASATGRLNTVEGERELCQRLVMKLSARRGGFAPLPDYGSRLHELLRSVKPSEREGAARQFAAEALADEPGVTVESAAVVDKGDGTAELSLALRVGDGALTLGIIT
ncbi:MAG: hypothetical protein RR314_04740 [Oscillospiraceae bacterium]